MRKFLDFLAVLLFTATIFGQKKYKSYNNVRFGYSISYPSDLLTTQRTSFNNDGSLFLSSNENTKLGVWAHYNALLHTVNEEYEEDLKNYGEAVTYKVSFKNGYVISGIKDNKIFYQKTLYHKFKDTNVFYIFTIEYEKSERKKFHSIVERIAKSFKFDPNADV